MILVDRFIPFLIEAKITERQFLLLYLVYLKRNDLISLYKEKYLEGMKAIPKKEMEDLRVKGFLVFNTRNEYIISDKFHNMFIDKFSSTDEIFEVYPAFMNHQGVDIPLKAMDRNVFANMYIQAIQANAEEHREVLKDIEFGKDQKLLNFGIEKFVSSRFWLVLREKRLTNNIKVTTNTRVDNEF